MTLESLREMQSDIRQREKSLMDLRLEYFERDKHEQAHRLTAKIEGVRLALDMIADFIKRESA